MSDQSDQARASILDRIAQAYAVLPGGADDPTYLDRYYRHVATEELALREPSTLAGAALTHRQLAQQRQPGTAKVQVFNPDAASAGWSSPRTVVQIVTDDMAFLVDSITGAVVSEDIDIHLLVHPQFIASRNASGELDAVVDADPSPDHVRPQHAVGDLPESWIMLTIDRQSDEGRRSQLESRIRSVLEDVRESVEDWPKMRTKCLVVAAELEGSPPPGVDGTDIAQAVSFLRWMADNHFTFLGYREYTLHWEDDGEHIDPVTGTGLGMLRADPSMQAPRPPLTESASALAHEPTVLVLTKANSRSTVHRTAYLDYVGVRVFNERGEVTGERRFLGLYASTAYTESVTRIPLVADKVRSIITSSGVAHDSHTGKDLMGILETYPRDELIQASVEELRETAFALTQLQERRRTKLFLREDDFERFVSCLVFIPRDRYNTAVRLKMAQILKDTFHGASVDFDVRVSDQALSRIEIVVRAAKGHKITRLSKAEEADLEHRLVEVSRTWTDRLGDALREAHGPIEGDRLLDRFAGGFPTAYEESFTVNQGVADLAHLDGLDESRGTSVALYRPAKGPETVRRFKLFRGDPLSLTDVLPIFTHMGVEVVDEQPFEIARADGELVHVYDFGLRVTDEQLWSGVSHNRLRELFEGAVLAFWDGRAESDGLNKLILLARMSWRQVVMLRAVARYLRQTRSTFSQEYIEDALVSNPAIAADLIALFETRFRPDRFDGVASDERAAAEAVIVARVTEALDEVTSLDHDRIIRSILAVVRAALRTNAFQPGPDGAEYKHHLSIKLEPKLIPDLPAPRPMFEIWVYSPRVEGVHLRFGPVARGGLRWSDRREDFRTEILGLVKAQMVKNAVIVPTGSKGGFFAKQLPDPTVDRGAWLEEGQAAYRMFISGLLDLTDNRVGTDIVAPQRVVRHDGDDSYLVVAADKGTATFSDLANGVAQSYGFWLDDAFASGGSAGYDHKAMGITARGAWESVKRHFREMGIDTQTQEFTVAGVGDMSGDVFGNGMLLSEHIRLVAAFDHRHIFIDPDPVADASYAERRRLFDLPRSSWDDYNRDLISRGGGVFARTLKSVPITPEMRAALDLPEGIGAMTPAELIHAILLSPVDLLWNGGIGTYVKATTEDNLSIGDRANDAIRVNGEDLRVKVVGEGGNLGLSQLGRIEAALHGIRVNTDAIDNSAGVDTSDHEVNIKILLGEVVRDGRLSLDERNVLLASMTDEVADHVLRDNYEQNVLLGNARAQEHQMLPVHERLIHLLEDRGDLDRGLEFLPSDAELAARSADGLGLKSPEFAVLVAYTKLALKHDLLESTLPDDPYFADTLAEYFPQALRDSYEAELADHPLRREIITNALANSMVNRGGITFVYRAGEETGASVEQVTRAFVVCREIFGLADWVQRIEALDNVVSTAAQTRLYLEFRRLLDRAVRWFLEARSGQLDIGAEIDRFGPVVAQLAGQVPDLLKGGERQRLDERAAELAAQGVPEDLALDAVTLLELYCLLDIVDISADTGREPAAVAPLYYLVSERFGIDSMLNKVSMLPRTDRWDALARGAMRDDLYAVLDSLTRAVLDNAGQEGRQTPEEQLAGWLELNEDTVRRSEISTRGILRLDRPNIAALSVALRTLRAVVRTTS
ncbi:MAG: NAD-glutamate dehydrogenase [Phycicoccus sp.]|nr:NAD-glutamate dehydrogenase [Phycicoccus sp.]